MDYCQRKLQLATGWQSLPDRLDWRLKQRVPDLTRSRYRMNTDRSNLRLMGMMGMSQCLRDPLMNHQ